MIIFLGIVGELATVIGSVVITLNAGLDSILEISKNGYKIEKSVLDEFHKKQAEEKKQYAKMEGKLQKLTFTAFTASKESEEEFFGFIGKRPIIVDHGLTSLYYEPLMSLDYTLDEVKRLNEATTYSYRIGKIDDKNVAIIGIPNPDSPVSRIQLKSEDYKITHTYEKMTEEEAQDKTFTVYPFMSETDDKVQKVVDEIKQSRIDMTTNVESLQTHSIFEPEIISTETEQVLSDEQQGPRLVKTIRPQNEKK